MIPITEAWQHVVDAARRLDAESIPIHEAIGRVLREPVHAACDQPPFDRVMMDGYALRAEDINGGGTLPLAGEVAAGARKVPTLNPLTCIEVMTGAPLPLGADAVVPVEHTERDDAGVRFGAGIRVGQHYAVQGEEIRRGEVFLHPGDVISPISVAAIAAAGKATVAVSRFPTLAVVTTGDEIVPVDETPEPGQIRDTNSWSLGAQARAAGLRAVRTFHAPDDGTKLRATLREALCDDLVVVTGGVSAGKYDMVPDTLRDLGVERVFHQVFQKPGKPLWFGKRWNTLVFGAPGNPLATVMTFHLYVRAAVAAMTGRRPALPSIEGTVTHDATYRGKRDLHVFVLARAVDGAYEVTPLPGKGSADVFTPAAANAVVSLTDGARELREGQQVAFVPLVPGLEH